MKIKTIGDLRNLIEEMTMTLLSVKLISVLRKVRILMFISTARSYNGIQKTMQMKLH